MSGSLASSPQALFEAERGLGLAPQYHSRVLEQWVKEVAAFSSQYGANAGNWGASNVVGPPTVYPKYGDNVNAWAPQAVAGKHFIEIRFERAVVPTEMHVYETSAPGALVDVQAHDGKEWISIWKGAAQLVSGKSRINAIAFPDSIRVTSALFRLEMDSSTWTSEWYEIDAVKLVGREEDLSAFAAAPEPAQGTLEGDMAGLLRSNTGDVELFSLDGKSVRVHRFLLTVRAPLLLNAELVRHEHSSVLQVALLYAYTGLVFVPIPIAISTYALARKLSMPRLEAAAADALRKGLTMQNVPQALKVVEDQPALAEVCVRFIVEHVGETVSNPAVLVGLSNSHLLAVIQALAQRGKAAG